MLISKEKTSALRAALRTSKETYCSTLFTSARWFVLDGAAPEVLNFIILPNKESAEYCAADLYGIAGEESVYFLPRSGKGIERSNYKSTLSVQRTTALNAISEYKNGKLYVVSYPEGISEEVPGREVMESSRLVIKVGDSISHDSLTGRLCTSGFERVDFVSAPGQIAVRGSIIDVFSYSDNNPYRISFWGDEVEGITVFNANTQLSIEKKEGVEIISDIISEGTAGSTDNIMNMLPEGSCIWLDSSDMYSSEEFFPLTEAYRRVYLDIPASRRQADGIKFNIAPQPVFNKDFELLTADIRNKIEAGFRVCVYGEKKSQLDRLKSILSQNGGLIPEFMEGQNIHSGFIDLDERVCCYSDHEIFDRFHRVSIRKSVEKSEQLTINDLAAFNPGDYVVHIDHGVGVFGGLVRMYDDKGRPREVVKLTYKDGDVVFVSVHALHKISRFKGQEGEPPRINKLGSKSWTNLKSAAKSKVKDIARDLIRLYAKRKASAGFAFSADSYLQQELESSFLYEDTPDQETATTSVKRDMEDSCPMDRLICGDVGFGKTEIAVRAAFKAVCDSKQVAVLVPTTILALQHFNTFTARLKGLPCNVEYVSRLRTAKEISDIRRRLAEGRIDILIGTHKILSDSFEFKDLGLLIIDEEQKFGVSAKEKLRKLRAGIDTLTLTATPIPRTLQFSLLGARDLSIIGTPPPNRIPVQTEIILFEEKEIRSIIEYELNRGGQVFFLHNKVEELPSIEEILHRLIPDMRICVAHGQMESRELENRMLDFIRGDYDLLLCTTIIENGLDIPNANTIIINQAQNIGLSDLHQLRGRVGRSNRKAFCFLIVPPLVSITDEARRRLRAIEEFSDLGSGFNIAMQDLDIRGAGNLLGAEQSGFLVEMGYEAYQKILSEAMEELGLEVDLAPERGRGGRFVCDCTIETDQTALIPDDYIPVSAEKIRIYKQLDSITTDKEMDRYVSTLEDRFGTLPAELSNLIMVVRIRNLGSLLGLEKIIFKNSLLICFFISNPMSPYYKSDTFASVMQRIGENPSVFALKQVETKLKIVSRGADSLKKAFDVLSKLQ